MNCGCDQLEEWASVMYVWGIHIHLEKGRIIFHYSRPTVQGDGLREGPRPSCCGHALGYGTWWCSDPELDPVSHTHRLGGKVLDVL